MKQRTKGFLRHELIDHDSEQFDYIKELHEYLWRFVYAVDPDASGSLRDYLPQALEKLEGRCSPS